LSFTVSHIAAILPITAMKTTNGHSVFDVTALIVGSMAPDFEFFIQMKPVEPIMDIPIGHTIRGMFYYNLPLCFLFAWIFHRIIKMPLLLHLPQPLVDQYATYAFQIWDINSWESFIIFCYSALLAMTIHILWDSFTHVNSPVIKHLTWLSLPVNLFSYTIPMYKFLDHSGTIVGFLIGLYYLYFWGHEELSQTVIVVSDYEKIYYFTMIVSIGIVVELFWLYRYGIPREKEDIAGPIIALISGLVIGIAVVSYLISPGNSLQVQMSSTFVDKTG
jgi:hypothetical protein